MGSPHPQYSTFTSDEELIDEHVDESIKRSQELVSKDEEPLKMSQQNLWKLVASCVLTLSLIFNAFGGASCQVLGGAIPKFELNAWRFGVQFIIMIPISIYRKSDIKVPRSGLLLVIFNIFLVNAVNIMLYTAYIYLSIGLADGLMYSLIIAGNAVLSICIKSDRKLILYIAAALALLGLVLMIQPDFLFSGANLPPPPVANSVSPCIAQTSTNHNNQTIAMKHDAPQGQTLGYIYILGTSICLSAHFHTCSKMVQDVHPFTFAFWSSVVGTGLHQDVILMLIFESPVLLKSSFCIGLLVMHCLGVTSLSLATQWGLQHIRPAVCATIHTLDLVIMMIFQYTFLRDIKPGLHNWVEILGAVICFCGMLGGPLADFITQD